MNFSIQIKESTRTIWTTLQEDNQNNDHSIVSMPLQSVCIHLYYKHPKHQQ